MSEPVRLPGRLRRLRARRIRRGAEDTPSAERTVADLAARCAALLAGGVPAGALWSLLAEEASPGATGDGDDHIGNDASADGGSAAERDDGPARFECDDPGDTATDTAIVEPEPEPAVPGSEAGRIAASLAQGAGSAADAIAEEAERVAAAPRGRLWPGSPRSAPPSRSPDPAAPWRVLAAAWWLAERSGAPLADPLRELAAALRTGVELGHLRDTALAGPRASARLVLALPPLGLGFGVLLGSNPIRVLFGSAVGLLLLLSALVLIVIATLWTRRLLDAVDRDRRLPGSELELLRIALGGGAPPEEARRRVSDAVDRFRVSWVDLGNLLGERGSVSRVLGNATRAGVPVRELLAAEAHAERVAYRGQLSQDTERLGVRLMLPLGVCVLPAFLALGVLPVLIGLLGDGLVAG